MERALPLLGEVLVGHGKKNCSSDHVSGPIRHSYGSSDRHGKGLNSIPLESPPNNLFDHYLIQHQNSFYSSFHGVYDSRRLRFLHRLPHLLQGVWMLLKEEVPLFLI